MLGVCSVFFFKPIIQCPILTSNSTNTLRGLFFFKGRVAFLFSFFIGRMRHLPFLLCLVLYLRILLQLKSKEPGAESLSFLGFNLHSLMALKTTIKKKKMLLPLIYLKWTSWISGCLKISLYRHNFRYRALYFSTGLYPSTGMMWFEAYAFFKGRMLHLIQPCAKGEYRRSILWICFSETC